jgi:hypothetical protein
MILLISASWIARIIGLSHQCLALSSFSKAINKPIWFHEVYFTKYFTTALVGCFLCQFAQLSHYSLLYFTYQKSALEVCIVTSKTVGKLKVMLYVKMTKGSTKSSKEAKELIFFKWGKKSQSLLPPTLKSYV